MKKLSIFALLFCLVFWACQNKKLTSADTDTPVEGDLFMVADESLQPIIDAEIQGYMAEYPRTKIHVTYLPEQKAINLMLKDSARVVATTRELSEKELSIFREKEIPYTPAIMAIDGVALITNRNNTDTLITMADLKKMFNGEIRKDLKLVFDNSSSSNLNYMIEKLAIKDIKKANIFAANGTKDVFETVKKNTNAIGIIGTNWISDLDDPKTLALRNSIHILSVASKENPTKKDYYKPNTENLTKKAYPLERKVYLHTKEARWGLGKGFIRYCCFQTGQLIVEKIGLIPYYNYSRDILMNENPIPKGYEEAPKK